ncbi:MAG: hypothetical protein IPG32_16870 [Saprospirales bacterium]|nr:hypothetical protein [Saprospirales bacterium]
MTDYYEKIEDYINDALSTEEKAAFERAMQADPELKTEIGRQRELLRRLEGMRRRQLVQQNIMLGTKGISLLWWLVSGIVACVVLVGVVLFFKIKEPSPLEEIPLPPPQAPVAVETPGASDTMLKKAPTPALREKAPSKALLAYAKTLEAQDSIHYTAMGDAAEDRETERLLNRAISLMRDHKPEEARKILQSILEDTSTFYREDAEWLYALTWLPRNSAQAVSRLKEIEASFSHPYRTRAMVLLEGLE